jgi:hypothetical protein
MTGDLLLKTMAVLWAPVIPSVIVAHYTYDAVAILVYATIGIVLSITLARVESRGKRGGVEQ